MKLRFDLCTAFFLLACINQILTAPIDDSKKNERCATAKGSIRSSVEDIKHQDKQIHLLADLDALSHGIKRAATEDDCASDADKKDEVQEQSAGIVPGMKKDKLSVQENSILSQIVNDEVDAKGSSILETGKAAIRSVISGNTSDNSSSTTADSATSVANDSSQLKEAEAKGLNVTTEHDAQNGTAASPAATTNAKTFIARNQNAVLNKHPVAGLRKVNIETSTARVAKLKPELKKGQQEPALHRSLHASIVPDDAPSMQRGSLAKLQDSQVKASTKSTSSFIAPLNNAIKSLDSATKLLGAAAAGKKSAPFVTNPSLTRINAAPASTNAILLPKAKAVNASSIDVSSTARSSATASTSKSASKAPAAAPAAAVSAEPAASTAATASTASTPPAAAATAAAAAPAAKAPSGKAAPFIDPYAEIASGPDSPKTPDLKTGTEKAGLPVMKVDPGSQAPEPVSFDKEETQEPAAPDESTSSNRPGPQDVGGVLDKITDRLNKGGSAIEQPLPPTEAKTITDELSRYDNDALQTAKGYESNGLKAIEKLKSAEFRHGNMKNELSKELTERLNGGSDMGDVGSPELGGGAGAGIGDGGGAGIGDGGGAGIGGGAGAGVTDGGGYSAMGGAGLGGEDIPAEVTNYGTRENYAPQPARQQYAQMNTMESLDSEAQREEQQYGQYAQSHQDNYADRYGNPGSDTALTSDSNAYDRQDISSYLNQAPAHDGMGIGSEQGNYFKRSVILRPLYYYYHHLPYAFRHPYDD